MESSVKQPKFDQIERNEYDLSHFCHQVGHIGRLTTLACVPIIAGDSMQLDLAGVFRASPLRRNMYLDYHVDIAAFYVKHRHDAIYGDTWVTFMKQGFDESQTLGTDTMAAGVSLNCLAVYTNPSTALPRWLTRGLPYIWNRFYRDPSDTAGVLAV